VWLRAVAVKDPQGVALLSLPSEQDWWTFPLWQELGRHPQLFESAFAWGNWRFNLASGGVAEFVDGAWTTAGMFDTLGVPPLLGRTFSDADDVRGGGPDGPVAVISHGFWQRRFGGAADVVGRRLAPARITFAI